MDGPCAVCHTPAMAPAAASVTSNWVDTLLDDGFWLGPAMLRLPDTDPAPRGKAAAKKAHAGPRPRRPRPLRAERALA